MTAHKVASGGSQPTVTDGDVSVMASTIAVPAGSLTDSGGGIATVDFPTYSSRVTLDAADIATMETSYFTLIPSLGADTIIIPLFLMAVLVPGAIPFDFSDNGQDGATFKLRYDVGGSFQAIKDLALTLSSSGPDPVTTIWVLDSTVDSHFFSPGPATSFVLNGDLGEAPLAGDGELRVTVVYTALPLT